MTSENTLIYIVAFVCFLRKRLQMTEHNIMFEENIMTEHDDGTLINA